MEDGLGTEAKVSAGWAKRISHANASNRMPIRLNVRIGAAIACSCEGISDGIGSGKSTLVDASVAESIAFAVPPDCNADVLVFDEATSALDSGTEAEVMAAINGLSRELTVFLIAHRMSTLDGCDVRVRLGE